VSRPPHLQDGADAEQRACAHLQAHGLRLVERNYRCRAGELDLIMDDGGTLVFVEVRYRRSGRYGGGLGSIDTRKQQRIVTAATWYLTSTDNHRRPCRFDVVGVGADGDGLEWIPDAFRP